VSFRGRHWNALLRLVGFSRVSRVSRISKVRLGLVLGLGLGLVSDMDRCVYR